MADILVVDDNQRLVLLLADRLRHAGHRVSVCHDGGTAVDLATRENFDCMVLDIALPVVNGLDVCRELRQRNVSTPILMLTARGGVADRVAGLRTGADDYLVKPFDMLELLARVDALLRRVSPRPRTKADVYRIGDLDLDFHRGEVYRDGTLIPLADLELRLLRHLVENRGSVVTRQELLSKVWNHDEPPITRTVDVRIGALRQKLESNPSRPTLITTVHGVGYKLVAD